jgi:hypothetical protein
VLGCVRRGVALSGLPVGTEDNARWVLKTAVDFDTSGGLEVPEGGRCATPDIVLVSTETEGARRVHSWWLVSRVVAKTLILVTSPSFRIRLAAKIRSLPSRSSLLLITVVISTGRMPLMRARMHRREWWAGRSPPLADAHIGSAILETEGG